MCGIVCIIVKDNTKVLGKGHIDIFKQMLYADALRGWDSTGIASISGDDAVTVVKDACTPGMLFNRTPDFKWSVQTRALVGHNRSATRGALNKENAHPFQEKHITLVHNGTLNTHRHMKDVQVDSHAITHSFVEKGAVPTLEQLDGAYALVWFDEETKLIRCTRNEQRPLFILESDDCFFIASEKELVQWICARNNLKIRKTTNCVPGTLYNFTENQKNQIYIEAIKYKLPAPKKTQAFSNPVGSTKNTGTTNQPKMLPNNVTQIRPHSSMGGYMLAEGDVIELLCYAGHKTAYNNYRLGFIQWKVESTEHPDVYCELYTDNPRDFAEMSVNAVVHKVFYSQILEGFVVVCKNPIPVHNVNPQKKEGERGNTELIETRNGIKLSKKVLALAKDCSCLFCSAPFVADKNISLVPVIKNNRLYKYQYHCPECSDYSTDKYLKEMYAKD